MHLICVLATTTVQSVKTSNVPNRQLSYSPVDWSVGNSQLDGSRG